MTRGTAGTDNPWPAVTVVIPTGGGRARLLERSLPILLDDPATNEVIVVMDGRDAVTRDLLQDWCNVDPRVRVEETRQGFKLHPELDPHDLGAQLPRDLGARVAQSEVVLALDDDVVPRRGLVTGHARCHSQHDGLVVLGYMPVVAPNESMAAMKATARVYAASYEHACTQYRAAPETILERLWGGNFSVSRHAWIVAADRDAARAGYHADRDFGLRLRALGLAGVFDSSLRAEHFYRRTANGLLDDALSAGRGSWHLARAHPDLHLAAPERHQRWAVRSALWMCRSRIAWIVMSRLLLVAALIASARRWPWPGDAAVRLLWLVGHSRGWHDSQEAATLSAE